MDVVILAVLVETVVPRKVEKGAVNFLKVPRIAQLNLLQKHLGCRACIFDLAFHVLRQTMMGAVVQQLQPVYRKAAMLRYGDRGTPPAFLASVELRAEKADDDSLFHHVYPFL